VMQSAMPQISSTSSSTVQSSSSGQASGGGPGDGPMDGGTPPDGGMTGDPSMAGAATQATPDAANSVTAPQNISPMLLNALIQMLETKAQAASQ
jgi:hypothetical protein